MTLQVTVVVVMVQAGNGGEGWVVMGIAVLLTGGDWWILGGGSGGDGCSGSGCCDGGVDGSRVHF